MNPNSRVLDRIAGHAILGSMGSGPNEAPAARAAAIKTADECLRQAGADPDNLPRMQPEEPGDPRLKPR